MSDEADESVRVNNLGLKRTTEKAQAAAASIDPGKPGDCDGCGEYFERVVPRGKGEFCGRCRDSKGLG
jgi:hypothetical protein